MKVCPQTPLLLSLLYLRMLARMPISAAAFEVNEVKGYCDMSAHADVSNACVCVLRWACADVCVCAACGHVCAYIDAPCCIKVSRGGSGAKA